MSGLITSGNTDENFGKFLPAPYIKKLYLSTNSDGEYEIAYEVEIYIRMDEESDEYGFIWDLQNHPRATSLTVMAINGAQFESLSTGDFDVTALFYCDNTAASSNPDHPCSLGDVYIENWEDFWAGPAVAVTTDVLDIALPDDDEGASAEIVYDDEGNRTLKINVNTLSVLDGNTDAALSLGGLDLTTTSNDWYFLAFFDWTSSSVEDDGLTESSYEDIYGGEESGGEWALDNPRLTNMSNFLALCHSEIAYEQIWDGASSGIPSGEETVWMDEDGNAVDEEPMQSTNSEYYTPGAGGQTLDSIKEEFEALVAEYRLTAEQQGDSDCIEACDQISYILETEGK